MNTNKNDNGISNICDFSLTEIMDSLCQIIGFFCNPKKSILCI